MRPLAAIVRWVVLAHARGPLLLVAVGTFGLLATAAPRVGDPGTSTAVRSEGAFTLGSGQIVLLGLAFVLPLATHRRFGPADLGSTMEAFRTSLSAALGHGLMLVLAGALLALVGIGHVILHHGRVDRIGESIRRVTSSGPESPSALEPGAETLEIPCELDAETLARGSITVRLAPKVLIVPEEVVGPLGTLRVPLLVRWTTGDGRLLVGERVVLRRGAPGEVGFDLPVGLAPGVYRLGIKRAAPGHRLVFAPDTVLILGRSASYFGTLSKGFLVQALSVWALLAIVMVLARGASYPIALAAGVTFSLLSAGDPNWLPGGLPLDPGRRMALGLDVPWSALVGVFFRSAFWIALVCALPIPESGRPSAP